MYKDLVFCLYIFDIVYVFDVIYITDVTELFFMTTCRNENICPRVYVDRYIDVVLKPVNFRS